jgi:hydroxymethylpyrimidine/phosphomethylpyrimidine kinase
MTPVVLSVGTTHPLAIAGLGLDLRMAASLGVRPVFVVAGVSAQSARALQSTQALATGVIAAQFAALADLRIDAVRIGALLDPASVVAVAEALALRASVPVIWDPVIAASTGEVLADGATVAAMAERLIPLATVVTPNLDEAGLLLQTSAPPDPAAMERAAQALVARGAQAALVKGGHLAGDAIDVLADSAGVRTFRSPRITATLRGTGDLLAYALACECAHGVPLDTAVAAARAFVRERIARGVDVGGTRAT